MTPPHSYKWDVCVSKTRHILQKITCNQRHNYCTQDAEETEKWGEKGVITKESWTPFNRRTP